jgi:hypothetical protein
MHLEKLPRVLSFFPGRTMLLAGVEEALPMTIEKLQASVARQCRLLKPALEHFPLPALNDQNRKLIAVIRGYEPENTPKRFQVHYQDGKPVIGLSLSEVQPVVVPMIGAVQLPKALPTKLVTATEIRSLETELSEKWSRAVAELYQALTALTRAYKLLWASCLADHLITLTQTNSFAPICVDRTLNQYLQHSKPVHELASLPDWTDDQIAAAVQVINTAQFGSGTCDHTLYDAISKWHEGAVYPDLEKVGITPEDHRHFEKNIPHLDTITMCADVTLAMDAIKLQWLVKFCPHSGDDSFVRVAPAFVNAIATSEEEQTALRRIYLYSLYQAASQLINDVAHQR